MCARLIAREAVMGIFYLALLASADSLARGMSETPAAQLEVEEPYKHNVLNTQGLRISIQPNKAPQTVKYDPRLALNSSDLSTNDPRVKKLSAGCEQPEQVHLTYWSSTAVLVSWASCDAVLGQTLPAATDPARSLVHYGSSKDSLTNTAEGVATSYAIDYSGTNGIPYASPVLHHVLLTGLEPGHQYFYRLADSSGSVSDSQAKLARARQAGRTLNFTLPKPATFPLELGILGDPGQTHNTSATLSRLQSSQPQLVVLLGDFCYADNWESETREATSSQSDTITYQPKWDTWGRLFEPLLSHVPLLHTNGNHEIEALRNGQRNKAYNHRYPTPQLTGHDHTKGPVSFTPVSQQHPFSNLYYTVELPGVLRYFSLTSYAPNQTFSPQEEQYKWLEQELQKMDRRQHPWVLVAIHAPMYHTYQGHYKEVECMRQSYEQLFVKYQVDLVLSGHVHAYERTKPVIDYQVSDCGPMYLTVGDGGNIEGIYQDYVDDSRTGMPDFCKDPQAAHIFPRYQPQACYSFQDGAFCPGRQPDWSAYREPSFGFGSLQLLSPTTAKWTWQKNQWPYWRVADEVTITRGSNPLCTSGTQVADL